MENKTSLLQAIQDRFLTAQGQTLDSFLLDNVFQFLFLWEHFLKSKGGESKPTVDPALSLRQLFSLKMPGISTTKQKVLFENFMFFCADSIRKIIERPELLKTEIREDFERNWEDSFPFSSAVKTPSGDVAYILPRIRSIMEETRNRVHSNYMLLSGEEKSFTIARNPYRNKDIVVFTEIFSGILRMWNHIAFQSAMVLLTEKRKEVELERKIREQDFRILLLEERAKVKRVKKDKS